LPPTWAKHSLFSTREAHIRLTKILKAEDFVRTTITVSLSQKTKYEKEKIVTNFFLPASQIFHKQTIFLSGQQVGLYFSSVFKNRRKKKKIVTKNAKSQQNSHEPRLYGFCSIR
jgi:hypothetical protein